MNAYKVIIIGAGTTGLTARRQVAEKTDSYLVIDDGPLGTTCARVGCMPSKALIQIANDVHQMDVIAQRGLLKKGDQQIDSAAVMRHVRSLRDRFVRSVRKGMEPWEKTHLLRGRAEFIAPDTVQVDGTQYKAEKFILAVGSRPSLLPEWQAVKDYIITTDDIFELEELPESILVMGLGVIGLELGQALSRLGIKVYGVARRRALGGVCDPEIQDYVCRKMAEEFTIFFDGARVLGVNAEQKILFEADGKTYTADRLLASIGRRHNTDRLQLEKAGITVNDRGLPEYDRQTLRLKEARHIWFAGDVNEYRPLLHEAADEGYIVGHNAVHQEACFKRRVPLAITFSDPNIARAGKAFGELEKGCFITGKVSFEGQGRSIVKLKEKGLLKVYADKDSGELLGAEMFAPNGEHLAHLLAWVIGMRLTVQQALQMPFYHPVLEEGLRTALRDAAQKLGRIAEELERCNEATTDK